MQRHTNVIARSHRCRIVGLCSTANDASHLYCDHRMTIEIPKGSLKVRSVFISDVHLGFKGCSAEYLLDFLKAVDTEYLYLVGDIIDVWSLKRTFYWPQSHNNVLRLILSKAKRGTKVIYVPGNHDEVFRGYVGHEFGNLSIQREAVHTTADGKRLLVLHGDEYDSVIKCAPWLGHLGNHAYSLILGLNRHLNWLRKKLGFNYWSLASYLKHKAKTAVMYIDRFEETLAFHAKRNQADGVVCGHIHRARIAEVEGVQYLNCGDWVESCTTLTEGFDGKLSLLHWTERQQYLIADHATQRKLPALTKAA
jgi:UDP-2,3-diacylglucosamine pyrophosphatase LpxH